MDISTVNTDIDKELEKAGIQAFKNIFKKAWQSRTIGIMIVSDEGEIKKHSPKAAMILTGHSCNLTGSRLSDYLLDPQFQLEQLIHKPLKNIDSNSETFQSEVFPTHTIRVTTEIISAPELQKHSLLILQNITDETTIIRDIQKKDNFLKMAREYAEMGYYLLDIPSGRWDESTGLDQLFGLPADFQKDIENWVQIIHPDDRQIMVDHYQKDVLENGSPFDKVYRIIRVTDKEVRWVHGRGQVINDGSGQPSKMVGIIQDITSQKKMEQSLKDTNREFREINDQKDKFLYIIAHDLRGPLNNLMGFLEILNTQFDRNTLNENKQLIQLLGSNAHSMYELVENLLNWALSQSGKMKHYPSRLHLHKLIKRVINQINPVAASKSIRIDFQIPEDTMVFADETMLITILRNLLSNAIKFSPAGSQVLVTHAFQNQKAVITVTDYGTGIAPDILPRLFLPSSSISTPGTHGESGTGFGLPLCYELTKIQNGHLWVESEPGKGSSFHLSLPVQ
jgi:PAS domain S-box-containing protein